ncbi:MAG TPA: SxtJ family membrane protein [Gemmatimonadaceae bacterium]
MTRPHAQSNPAPSEGRKVREGRIFALTLAGGFLFLALLTYWRHAQRVAVTAAALAAISLLAATLVPGRLEPVQRVWMKIGEGIGYITTPIVMAIVYYLAVTPIAVVRRLRRTRRQPVGSNWHRRPPLPARERMERQF